MQWGKKVILLACVRHPDKLFRVLSEDLGFTLDTFRERVFSLSPGICRIWFSSLMQEPFDPDDPERVARLIDMGRQSRYMGEIIHFLYVIKNPAMLEKHRVRLLTQKYYVCTEKRLERQAMRKQEREELFAGFSTPVLDVEKSDPRNPFKPDTKLWRLFEYAVRYTGDPKNWGRYVIHLKPALGIDYNTYAFTGVFRKLLLERTGLQLKKILGTWEQGAE